MVAQVAAVVEEQEAHSIPEVDFCLLDTTAALHRLLLVHMAAAVVVGLLPWDYPAQVQPEEMAVVPLQTQSLELRSHTQPVVVAALVVELVELVELTRVAVLQITPRQVQPQRIVAAVVAAAAMRPVLVVLAVQAAQAL
jgi:hypothetical protein